MVDGSVDRTLKRPTKPSRRLLTCRYRLRSKRASSNLKRKSYQKPNTATAQANKAATLQVFRKRLREGGEPQERAPSDGSAMIHSALPSNVNL